MVISFRNISADNVLRNGLPFALAALCLYSFPQFANTVSFSQIFELVFALPIWVWVAAGGLTAASFYSVGQYDVLARRHLGLSDPEAQTRQTGMKAVALSQAFGFGLITGSLARYRFRPDEGPLRAGQITVLATVFFMTGLLFTVTIAIVISGALVDRLFSAMALLALMCCALYLTLARPHVRIMSRKIIMPSLPALRGSIFWSAADLLAAALAFYVLLPSGADVNFLIFLPVFCIAMGAGILSGVPGGVGPFEIVLLSLTAPELPTHIDQAALLTAVCGFRVVYYGVPALIAALFVLRPGFGRPVARYTGAPISPHGMPRAEAGVVAQNGGALVPLTSGTGALWPAGNSLVSLFDPKTLSPADWMTDFADHARTQNMMPVIYKCSARQAVAARQAGWQVVNVANDAMLNPTTFDLDGAKRSGLRRKLRKAIKSGVTIVPAAGHHMAALQDIDAQWQARCGGARGGTMGRFCHYYLAQQMVLVAEQDGAPVAFVSFHLGQDEWALDLLRDTPATPDGTMYLLIHEAIKRAAAAQIPELSLAAVPATCPTGQGMLARPLSYLREKWAARGLLQFKSAFGPRWKPLYMASPSSVGFCVGAIDLLREIQRPARIRPPAAQEG